MRRAQVIRLFRRMEWIAEADATGDDALAVEIAGNQARNAAAHGLAADEETLLGAEFLGYGFDSRAVFRDEALGFRWRLAGSFAAGGHIGEFEPDDADIALRPAARPWHP